MERDKNNPNWRVYEQIVTTIMDTLEGFPNIEVTHDAKLIDKDGCECQVDVLIEYGVEDGKTEKTIVECKHRSDNISRFTLGGFIHLCESVGALKGLFVSHSGFQSGALHKAQSYDWLELKTLSEFNSKTIVNSVLKPEDLSFIKFKVVEVGRYYGNISITTSNPNPPSQ